jgi:hypothetical protein
LRITAVACPQPVLAAIAVAWTIVCSLPTSAFAQTPAADDLISLNDHGLEQLHANDLDEAERTFKRVIQLADGGKSDLALARALNNLGNVHRSRGRPAEAIALCARSASIFLKLHDYRGIAEAESNLAAAHFALGHHDDAFLYASHVTELYAMLGVKASRAEDVEYFLERLIVKVQFLVRVLKEMRRPDLAKQDIARARPVAAKLSEMAIARLDLAEASLDERRRPWRALPTAWRLERFFAARGLERDAIEANAVLNASIRPLLLWIAFGLLILGLLIDLLVRPGRLLSVVTSGWRFVRRPVAAVWRWTWREARQPVLGEASVLLTCAFLAAEYGVVTQPTLRAVDAAGTILSGWPLPGNLKFLLSDMLARLPHYMWLGLGATVLFFGVWLLVSFVVTRWLSFGIESMLRRVMSSRRLAPLPTRVDQALAAERGDAARLVLTVVRVAAIIGVVLLLIGTWDFSSAVWLSPVGLAALVVVECALTLRQHLLIRRLRRIKPYQVYERLYPPARARGPAMLAALAVFAWVFVPLCLQGYVFLQTSFVYQPFHDRATRLASALYTGAGIYHSFTVPGEAALVFAAVSQAFEPAKGAEAVGKAIQPFLPTIGLAALIMWFFALTVPWALSLLLKDPRRFWRKVSQFFLASVLAYLIDLMFAIDAAPLTMALIWTVVVTTVMWSFDESGSDELDENEDNRESS